VFHHNPNFAPRAPRKSLDYGEGSVIVYNAFGGLKRTVLVDEKESDIKNGRAGFSGELVGPDLKPLPGDDNGVWGYDDQIVRVVRR